MDPTADIERWLATGRERAAAVYSEFRVDRAVEVAPTPGGAVEDELYTDIEQRVRTGEKQWVGLKACGVVSVHRPGVFTQLFDVFLANLDRYLSSPPTHSFGEESWYVPEVPPLYAALAIVLQTDAEFEMKAVVGAVLAVEEFGEDGFAGELMNLMLLHPEAISTVATYFEHPEADVRYLVARGAALALEDYGAAPDVAVPSQYEPLIEAAVEHGLADSDDRVVYRSALVVYFAAVADTSPVSQYEAQVEQRLAECENEDATNFLESAVDAIQ